MREPELQIIEHIDTPENPDWDIINLEICEIWERNEIENLVEIIKNKINQLTPTILEKIHKV